MWISAYCCYAFESVFEYEICLDHKNRQREREREMMRYYYESRKNIPYISYVTVVREYIQKKNPMIMSYLQGTLKYLYTV